MSCLRAGAIGLCMAVLASAASGFAATPAVFRGRVVEMAKAKTPHTIFVLSRNGSLRKVTIESAQVAYAKDMPQRFRKSQPHESLVHGAEVRVEALENGSGLWRATSIEILQVPGSPEPKETVPMPEKRPAPTLSRRTAI